VQFFLVGVKDELLYVHAFQAAGKKRRINDIHTAHLKTKIPDLRFYKSRAFSNRNLRADIDAHWSPKGVKNIKSAVS
jgi:hypothetical protein